MTRSSRRRFYVIGFLILLGFDTFAQVCFKLAALDAAPFHPDLAWLVRAAHTPWVYGSLLAYGGALVTWISLLERAPLGPAFAASHLEVVSVLLLSAVLFNEPLGLSKLVGCAAIVLGIVCLAAAERDQAFPHR